MTRVVLITGCSSGVGLETALAFARAGDIVCAGLRDLSGADRLQAAAEKENLSLTLFELDVCRPDLFAPTVERIIKECGGLDVLVNNAGVLPVGAFEDVKEAALRATMEVNFFGPALLTQVVLPHMRARGGGYIINISSLSGMASKGGDAVYAASKFALEGLCEGYRNEIARWNIKTALVEPGQYATNIFRQAKRLADDDAHSPYRQFNEWLRAPMRGDASQGADPRTLAELIVEISRSDGSRLRWPADEVAKRVMKAVFAQSDEERGAFLRGVGDMDWWIEGRDAPA